MIKLRVILLLEADFNAFNTLVLNTKVIPFLEYYKFILSKVIGRR